MNTSIVTTVVCLFFLCIICHFTWASPLSKTQPRRLSSSKTVDCSIGTEETEDNPIPACYVHLDFDPKINTQHIEQKIADLNNAPIAKGDDEISESVVLAHYPWVIQQCRNWCGPAALQGTLQHFHIKQSQAEIAKQIDAGDCDNRSKEDMAQAALLPVEQKKILDYRYRGTCLTEILLFLNKTVRRQLYGAEHFGDELGSFQSIAEMVVERVSRAVKEYRRPVIALINQTPPNLDHHFPGWEKARPSAKRAHYITLIGYGGNYTGADRSGFFYFRDSSGHNRPPNDTVDVNTVVIDLIANHGRGSCSKQGFNLIW